MQGYLIRDHGGPERLERVELQPPSPPATGAIVRVQAVGLNHLDVWVRRGVPGHRFPLPLVPGSEAAGVIHSLPTDYQGALRIGQEVIVAPGWSCGACEACEAGEDELCPDYHILGESIDGGGRELMSVPLRNLLPKPARLSIHEAAASALDFQTAWHMLIARAGLRFGETVLVQAGGSGVGSAAIQIARLHGCRIITTTGSGEKAERARKLGADEVILYRQENVPTRVRELTNRRGVDVVVEHVGADTWEGSVRSLTRGGRLVTCGATTGAEAAINLRVLFFKSLSLLGSTMGRLDELRTVLGLMDRGLLEPVVDRVLPIREMAEAHRLIEERALFGKVVLDAREGSW